MSLNFLQYFSNMRDYSATASIASQACQISFIAPCTALDLTVLGLPDLATQVKFLEPSGNRTVINSAVTFHTSFFLFAFNGIITRF